MVGCRVWMYAERETTCEGEEAREKSISMTFGPVSPAGSGSANSGEACSGEADAAGEAVSDASGWITGGV